jgi:hypothetical protein
LVGKEKSHLQIADDKYLLFLQNPCHTEHPFSSSYWWELRYLQQPNKREKGRGIPLSKTTRCCELRSRGTID